MDDVIPESISNKLRKRAQTARERVKVQAELDKNCSADVKHSASITVTQVSKFLDKFLDGGTLDLPSAHPFVRKMTIDHRREFHKHHVYVDSSVDHDLLEVDQKWIKAQDDYILRLKKEQLFDLYGYTHQGDVFINNYIRGTFSVDDFKQYLEEFDIDYDDVYFCLFFPALRVLTRSHSHDMLALFLEKPSESDVDELIAIKNAQTYEEKYIKLVAISPKLSYDRFWILVLENYRDSIEDIISKAPPTPKPIVLYRGVDSDYFLTKYMKNHVDRVHIANSFVSTSSSVDVVNKFINLLNKCCFMRLYVPAGTRMIMMMGVSRYALEAEFLLSHKSQFYIKKTRVEKFCKGTLNSEMRTTTLIVI